jgi:L-threonylcarbamoyladenylate synthase
LTLVLPKQDRIPDLVTSGLPRVGLRIPDHPVALELLRAADRPIAAPSANPFGGISPTSAQHVLDGLNGRIDAVLDGGHCRVGVESTVVGFDDEGAIILRPGGLPIEDIEAVIGPVRIATPDPDKDDAAQPAPGMLARHYAPSTPLELVDMAVTAKPTPELRCGLLTWGQCPADSGFSATEQLSPSADLRTCAAAFFAALRRLDSSDLDVIIAHRFPHQGLGIALNDRLQRAAT